MGTQTSAEPGQTGLHFAELLDLRPVPGHCAHPTAGGTGDYRCSCGQPRCPEPGAHPWRSGDPSLEGTSPAAPCSLLLPLGQRCDALDVPVRTGEVGLGYLRMWTVPLGPVIEHGDWMVFLVAPEAREDIPGLMVSDRLGDPRRGIRYRGDGYQVLPPANAGTPAEAHWAVEPVRQRCRLPTAAELLGALDYARHQLHRTRDLPAPARESPDEASRRGLRTRCRPPMWPRARSSPRTGW